MGAPIRALRGPIGTGHLVDMGPWHHTPGMQHTTASSTPRVPGQAVARVRVAQAPALNAAAQAAVLGLVLLLVILL